jgi:hypothetical protein
MRVLALIVLFFAFPAQAGIPIAWARPFSMQQTLLHNGVNLGTAELQNKQTSPGRWQLVSRTIATKGIARLTGVSANEQSNLILRDGQLELYSNRIETRVALKTQIKTTQLSDDGKTYRYTDNKGSKQAPYQPGLLDQHSLTLALMADLNAGKKGPNFTYMVINRDKIEPYTFKIINRQTLDTAIGKLPTVRVDRVLGNSTGKNIRIWFATDKNFTPVLTHQINERGDDIEMRILTIQ